MQSGKHFTEIYADSDIVVLNKSSGTLSTPDRYERNSHSIPELASSLYGKLFTVHRLDKDTSGVIIYARNKKAHKVLCEEFFNHKVKKTYHAFTLGRAEPETFDVDLPLRTNGDRLHRTVIDGKHGSISLTHLRTLALFSHYSFIEAVPETGRTHQIRVHLKARGLPIVCDALYNRNTHPIFLSELKRRYKEKKSVPNERLFDISKAKLSGLNEKYSENTERPLLSRLALHARSISFIHPTTSENLTFTAPYPRDFKALISQVQKIFHLALAVDPD